MRRVETGGKWSLFCPNEAPGLCDVHGAAFDELYERYEREGRARESVDAQKIWFSILESQMETGTPLACPEGEGPRSQQPTRPSATPKAHSLSQGFSLCARGEEPMRRLDTEARLWWY